MVRVSVRRHLLWFGIMALQIGCEGCLRSTGSGRSDGKSDAGPSLAEVTIGPPPAVFLERTLAEWETEVREQPNFNREAGITLAERGKESLPLLVHFLRTGDTRVRRGSAHLLALMGPPASAAVPDLVQVLAETRPPESPNHAAGCYPRWHLRYSACHALLAVGPSGKVAIPILVSLLDDRWDCGCATGEQTDIVPLTLALMTPESLEPVLRAAERDHQVKHAPYADSYFALEYMRHDPDPRVQLAARAALGRMGIRIMDEARSSDRISRFFNERLPRQRQANLARWKD